MRNTKFFLPQITILLLVILLTSETNGQKSPDLKEMFLEAESYFLFEEYKDALPLYQILLEKDPDNDNLNYKIGICYLNDPYLKDRSIDFLEKAIKNINPKYKQNSFKERKAPAEALYFLGRAYSINNRLKDAISKFKEFLDILNPEIYDVDLVKEQIQASKNALRLRIRPVFYISENLGDIINTPFSEINPVISGDESTLVFTKKLRFYDAVFYSKKVAGEWSYPINLTPQFGLDGNSYTTGLSYKGDEIYVYRSDGYDGNIYVSKLIEDTWSKLEKLNENINTKYWESHASLSSDGKTLYFTSNRKGGYGGLDIYKSEKTGRGNWGPPLNLGNVVNTKYNEETPFITSDDKTLYFSSFGHFNIGDYDIFYSTISGNGTFNKPVNIGYPINTMGDDLFYVPVGDGRYGYYSMYDPDNVYGLNDIFKFEVFSERHPRKFTIKGNTRKSNDLNVNYDNIKIKLINNNTQETVAETIVNNDGTYTLNTIQGNYIIVLEGDGIKNTSQVLTIPINNPDNVIAYVSDILPEDKVLIQEEVKDIEKPEISIKKSLYEVTSDNTIPIKLNLKRNTKLLIEVYDDGELLKSEEFNVVRKKFVYSFKPNEGTNMLKFVLTDNSGNTNTQSVTINYTPAIIEVPVSADDEVKEKYERDEFVEIIGFAEGDLKEYLENIDWKKVKIKDEYELYNFLIDKQAEGNYSIHDVDKLFIDYISSGLDVDFIYHSLLFVSDGELKKVLTDLNLQKENIQTSGELLDYLWKQTIDSDNSREQLVELLTALKRDSYENIELFLRYLEKSATGNLKAVIQELDIREKKILTYTNLVYYLISKAPLGNFSRESVYQLLLDIISPENTETFLDLLKQNAGSEINEALNNIDLNNFSTPLELIKYLIGHSDNYSFDETDIIDLLLKIVFMKDLDIGNLDPDITITNKKASSKLKLAAAITAGIIIILLLIAIIRKKKKKT